MNQQLPLRFRLAGHTSLEDYVGSAPDRLMQLGQLVYLVGGSGSGKSHLLQGLCHHELERGGTAVFMPMMPTLEPSILSSLESFDLVCLDDIDAVLSESLSTSAAWQEALFHLINGCKDQGKKLVMSSAVPVSDLQVELGDLRSRLKAAYHLGTDDLSDDEKLAVIKLKARRRGFEMGEDVCAFILSRSQRDMHHLARLVEQLDEETLRQQKKVTIPFVKSALGL